MHVYQGPETLEKLPPSVVTTGTFDGVHLGHQQILKRLNKLAADNGLSSTVITFWPHPRFVLGKGADSLQLLSTLSEKTKYLKEQGIDNLLVVEFTKDFAKLGSEEFIQKILIEKANTRCLVMGYDHRFGKNREGSFEHLKKHSGKWGFELEEISAQQVDEVAVSSTKIREALRNGDITTANQYLGKPYQLSGEVVKGEQLGRKLGFPTANIHLQEPYKLIPQLGTYVVEAVVEGEKLGGMLNIGVRPTVSDKNTKSLEVHLFNWNKDLYGKKLTVFLTHYIRHERKFNSIEELKEQLEKDKQFSLQKLNL